MYSKVVFIGLVWPEPDTTAAGTRMLQLIRFFQERSDEIHFACTALRSNYSYPLEEMGVHLHPIELNDSSFDMWIANLTPDVVVFDRFITEEQFSWRVRENCPGTLRILDSEDLHFLRAYRRKTLPKKTKPKKPYIFEDVALRELASIFRSDLTLIISEVEMNILTRELRVPKELLYYLPFMLAEELLLDCDSLPTFSERVDFMTIGNWKHGPNKDSVYFLKETIWPKIRSRLPEARFHVYGAYGPGDKSELHNEKNGFLIEGWKESKSEAFLAHKVCLAPLRYGAGLKGKLFDALRFSTPSVTTSIGAEGIEDPESWCGYVSDDPEKFVEGAVALYLQEDVWLQAQSKCEEILRERFLEKTFISDFEALLDGLQRNINASRSQNLTGALLWHHSAQSTKYLSKWIESKNKNQSN